MITAVAWFVYGLNSAEACVIAAPPGSSVKCLGEEALIVWDSFSRTQELVRSINVQSHAADFALLTTTPAFPTIRPVEQDLFLRAYTLTKPKVSQKVSTQIRWSWFFHSPSLPEPEAEAASLAAGLLVGVDNMVFSAEQAGGLASWFDEHGYDYTPALKKWVAQTVEKKGFITASRVKKPKSAATKSRLRIRTLQMSFQSSQPIYPSREPSPRRSTVSQNRQMRLYVVSDALLGGSLDGEPWKGELIYAQKRGDLQPQLGPFFVSKDDVPGVGWLALYSENTAYRAPKDDLRFVPVPNPKPLIRQPQVIDDIKWVVIPLDLIALFLGTLFAVLKWWRRRRFDALAKKKAP